MSLRWGVLPILILIVAIGVATPAVAKTSTPACPVPNAAGVAAGLAATGQPAKAKGNAKKKKNRKQKRQKQKKVFLQPDSQSVSRSVNLGDDREPEEVTLRVNLPAVLPKGFERKLELVAEPFITTSETGETVSFSEPMFSELTVSGNRKRITFEMCIDPPNDLPAGKYTSTVMLEGPPPTESAVMTVTLNAKDGHGFILAAALTAVLAFLILLYKGAGEKRTVRLAEAAKETDSEKRKAAVAAAERWWNPTKACLRDPGWLVPTLASIAAAFALLWAAYDSNPAWGEGGIVTSAIALIGTGLAAVGAKAIFTQGPSAH
jgi:hypothetical protein